MHPRETLKIYHANFQGTEEIINIFTMGRKLNRSNRR
jgi:hypothetical protein